MAAHSHPNPPASGQNGRNHLETITTNSEHQARIQMNSVEAAEIGNERAQALFNDISETCPTRLVPTSARDSCVPTAVPSNGKRKLDRTDQGSPPAAKRINSTRKESHEQTLEPEEAEKYKFWSRAPLRAECRSRFLPAQGDINQLRQRLYDAARMQTSSSQESVKQNVTSYTSSEAEPSDSYTSMLQKDLRKECTERSLPVSLSKKDLRRCLRLYDAARALGLTHEESLEAQKATFQQSTEEDDRSVSPWGSTVETAFGAASEETIKGHRLDNAPRDSIMARRQGPKSHETLEYDTSTGTYSPASSGKATASSSTTSLASTQDRGSSNISSRPLATLDYTALGTAELRSLCKARSLKQHGFGLTQLRMALIAYDRSLTTQAKAGVEVDAEHRTEELGVVPSVSSPPPAFIDLDLSSQDGKTPGQRTRLVGASAEVIRKQPVSGDLSTAIKTQPPPVAMDGQLETGKGGPIKHVSARTPSEKGQDVRLYQSQPVLKSVGKLDNESSPWSTPYPKHAMALQQPLVSLLNLSIKDIEDGASEDTYPGTQIRPKRLSEHAVKVAEKEEFNAKYVTESPYWICCCNIPSHEVGQKQLADLSGNCCYHVSLLARRGTFTMKEYQQYLITQQAVDRTRSCLCQKRAVDSSEHHVTMTRGGFILAQIWREQLIRRYSLSTLRPDMAAYRRKSILEVMHNILEDFMIELSSREQKRPLVLWARIEAMAWFTNTLPETDEWHYFQNWSRPRQYIMLFGIALLTTVDALLQQNLFKDNDSQVPNLGLVIALFVQTTWNSPSSNVKSVDGKDNCKQPFNKSICVNNENGWAAVVVSLTEQHGVRLKGVPNIDYIVDQWRLRKKSLDSIRDWARKKRYAISHKRGTASLSDATLASIAAKEGETPARKGTGPRATWMPEDDYDDNGIRLWKKWFYLCEFEIYTKEHEVTNES